MGKAARFDEIYAASTGWKPGIGKICPKVLSTGSLETLFPSSDNIHCFQDGISANAISACHPTPRVPSKGHQKAVSIANMSLWCKLFLFMGIYLHMELVVFTNPTVIICFIISVVFLANWWVEMQYSQLSLQTATCPIMSITNCVSAVWC